MSSNSRVIGAIVLVCGIIFVLGCDDTVTDHNFPVPPNEPSNPSPVDGAVGIDTVLTFGWQCSDSNGDSLVYDIYLDTLTEPVIIDSNLTASIYTTARLEVYRDYYWKVVARDEGGLETSSPGWHFSTIPGAEQIAFVSYRTGNRQIFIMNPDGSNAHSISNPLNPGDMNPVLSNDGSKIVFEREGGGMFMMNHDGAGRIPVSYDDINGHLPVWSPDGSHIAYVADGGNEVFHVAIWVADANGENPHQITGNIIPDWESDKISWSMQDQFVFTSDSTGGSSYAIYAINSDGTNLRQITTYSYFDMDPAWSHDCTRIAFSRLLPESNIPQIFVMNSDGTDIQNIQNSESYGTSPCWSPDDSQIAYTRAVPGDNEPEIYVMNADGTNQHNITGIQTANWFPSWGPYHR
jgi:TolB protein